LQDFGPQLWVQDWTVSYIRTDRRVPNYVQISRVVGTEQRPGLKGSVKTVFRTLDYSVTLEYWGQYVEYYLPNTLLGTHYRKSP